MSVDQNMSDKREGETNIGEGAFLGPTTDIQ
jgi:hypothetical protein